MNKKRRVFCVGLDGGTWTVLRPLMEAGHMPNLVKLAKNGISGILNSTIPPITPAAWSTFMTGCNPGKHGIFDFLGYDRQRDAAFLVNATNLRVPTLWQILSEYGLRVAVVDLPMTYPPPRINGVLISGLTTPGREAVFTQPESLRDEVERQLGYPWPLLKEEEEYGVLHANLDQFLELMRGFVNSRGEAMLYLLQREPWDFAFIQFQCLDFLQHPFWKFLDPEHPAFSPAQQQKLAAEFFAPLDAMLGKLFAAAKQYMGPETLRVVVSDHGFQRHRVHVELNHWLYQQGFLVPRKPSLISWRRYTEWIRRLDVLQLRKRLISKTKCEDLVRTLNLQMIDRQRSLAWAFSSFWGYLYFGSSAGSADIQRLEAVLRDWRDPHSGASVVHKIYRPGEIYSGESLDRLPDVIIEPTPGYTFASKTYFHSGVIFSPIENEARLTGHHAPEGIYLLAGPEVQPAKHGRLSAPAALQDMAPTLLHWLQLPIPKQMDGVVQAEWFETSTRQREPEYAQQSFKLATETVLPENEQEDIKARLHALGYL